MLQKLTDYLVLLRVHQYLKNVFILLPIFFAGRLLEMDLLASSLVAFVYFSLIASAVYVFNDIFDIEEDARHPLKRNRPIAAGKVMKDEAYRIMAGLIVVGFVLAALQGFGLLLIMAGYLVLNVLYTVWLKHIAVLDVMLIAVFYVLRLQVGSMVTGVELSMWIIIITYILAVFLSLAKRRDDLLLYLDNQGKTRKVLDGYNIEFLNSSMVIMAGVIIVSYIMYTISAEVIIRVQTDKLYLTVVFVIMGVMRYLQVAFVEKKAGSPTLVLIRDRMIQIIILCWLVSFGIILYG